MSGHASVLMRLKNNNTGNPVSRSAMPAIIEKRFIKNVFNIFITKNINNAAVANQRNAYWSEDKNSINSYTIAKLAPIENNASITIFIMLKSASSILD